MFTNGLNLDLPWQAWLVKRINVVETHWLSSKENVLGTAVVKNVKLTVFWDMKGPITMDFLLKSVTKNKRNG